MIPTTERSVTLPVRTGCIAATSEEISTDAISIRAKRCSTSLGSLVGSARTSRAGIMIGRRDCELTRRRSGFLSTTIRFTYQSPQRPAQTRQARCHPARTSIPRRRTHAGSDSFRGGGTRARLSASAACARAKSGSSSSARSSSLRGQAEGAILIGHPFNP